MLAPVDSVERALHAVLVHEPQVRAWAHIAPDQARAAALQLEAVPSADRSALFGLPVAVKDIIDVGGMPTRRGLLWGSVEPAHQDAGCVARLREAGVVPLGKAVTTPLAFLDPGPTRNPHDVRRTPGGSSSGSAAAVAAGMVPLALGTQTGGSTIVPASFCGVWALRVGWDRVDLGGVWSVSPTFDTLGLFAQSGALLEAMTDVLLPDGDSTAPPLEAPRIAVARTGLEGELSGEVRSAIADAEQVARARGASTYVVDLRAEFDALSKAHGCVSAHEMARVVAADPVMEHELLPPQALALMERGAAIGPAEAEIARAEVTTIAAAVRERVGDAVAVLAPAVAGIAPVGDLSPRDSRHARPLSALGWPAVAVPFGYGPGGMPIAVQLLAPPRTERRLVRVARWLAERQ
jgi:Asp-tRNA(Asn)/Glu-tRNA(Gln) amidotransferase A subunit family amidase